MEIADVIAYAVHFQLLLYLSPAGGGAGGHHGERPGGARRSHGPIGTSGSSKKAHFGGDEELVSSPPSFSGMINWG